MDMNDFKANGLLLRPIVVSGRWSNVTNSYQINDSSILTELIHAAGRWCERYASDLFIDWKFVEKAYSGLAEGEKVREYLFGFRKDGVDHADYVLNRAEDNHFHYVSELEHYYRAMYKLSIFEIHDEDGSWREMKLLLERIF